MAVTNNKLFSVMSTSFNSFDSTVKTYLTKAFDSLGIEYNNSQIFNVIFEGIKGVMQNVMFYIEDALTEQNIYTATRKKSVYALAKASGYEPYYGSAASGTILAKVQSGNNIRSKATKLYIDNYQRIINKRTGIIYTILLNSNKYVFDITAPLVNHELKVVQGVYKSYQFAATGEALERVSINITGLFDRDYIDVYVNGEKWECVPSIYDMHNDSKTFVLEVGYENTFDVIFGNGIYGRIPNAGDSITIYFLGHSGVTGNVSSSDVNNFKFESNGYDSFGNTVDLNNYIKLSVESVISGGTNSDTIDFVREMIGCNSRSNVLASEDNFRLFFKRFSFIGAASCWSDTNSMIMNMVCTTNVLQNIKEYSDYYNVKPSDMILSDTHKEMILHTLNNSNKTYAGLRLNIEDPVIREYAIICYLKTSNVYTRNIVKEDIKNAFAKYFMNISDGTLFIPKSDLVTAALESNNEIESFDIDIISKTTEDAFKTGYYYEYESKLINGTYKYAPVKVFYEKDKTPCVDDYGNISLKSRLEVPMLHGGFKYYPNKAENDKKSDVTVDAIQFFFL